MRRSQDFAESPRQRSYHWILARGEQQFDAQRRALRLSGAHPDVTERKRATDRFRGAVRASPTGSVMVDYAAGDPLGGPIDTLEPPSSRAQHMRAMAEYMSSPCERQLGEGRELYGRHRDGHSLRIEVSLTLIEATDADYVLASVVDITERLRAEQRISQLQAS